MRCALASALKVLTILVALAPLSCAANQTAAKSEGLKVLLKPKTLAPGRYVMKVTLEGQQDQTSTEKEPIWKYLYPMGFLRKEEMLIEVSERDKAGEWTIDVTCRHFMNQSTLGGMTFVYDSKGPADQQNPEMAKALAPLFKIKTTARFGADDKLILITESITDPKEAAQQSPELTAVLSNNRKEREKTIRDLVEKAGEELPPNPVSPGDQWETTYKAEDALFGQMEFKQQWRLTNIEEGPGGDIAILVGTGQGQITINENIKDKIGTDLTGSNFQIRYATNIRFNLEMGMKEKTTSSAEIVLEKTEHGENGEEIHITSKMKVVSETMLQKENAKSSAPVSAAVPKAPENTKPPSKP